MKSGPNQSVEDLWHAPFHTQEVDGSQLDLVVSVEGAANLTNRTG